MIARGVAFAVTGAFVFAAQPLEAQDFVGYGVGYTDGDDTHFGLLGGMVRPGGLGWQPVGSLEVYTLTHDVSPTARGTFWGVAPGAGLLFAAPDWQASARLSWHFVSGDAPAAPFFVGGESGLGTTLQAIYFGGVPSLEGLANFNWPAEFLWSEAKAHFPIVDTDPGSIDLGGEVIWQTGWNEGDSAFMFGPSLRWSGPAVSFGVAGGPKLNPGDLDNTWYGRVMLVIQ